VRGLALGCVGLLVATTSGWAAPPRGGKWSKPARSRGICTTPGGFPRSTILTVGSTQSNRLRRTNADVPPDADTAPARLGGHLAAQYVPGSDGAISGSARLGDGFVTFAVAAHHYFERQPKRPPWTLTMPAGMFGLRIDDRGPMRAYVEGGVVYAWTRNDMAGDSKLSGPVLGVHFEYAVAPRTAIIGDAHAMYFQSDVRAYAARIAIRRGFAELAVRALGFNVGPALYGPELGARF
jgi:hypothetical protein